MNAPTPALVASRPERLRLVGQRRQILTMMHQRLMFGMLVYGGVIALIVVRILWLAAFGDHAGAKRGITSLIPERGDIIDRDGVPLARSIDAWTIGLHPKKVIGDKLTLARKLAQLMPEHDEAAYFAMLRSDKTFYYLRRRAAPGLVEAVNALGEPGLALEREPDRLYPQTSLAAHVIGYTTIDGHGVAGMERAMDERLTNPETRGQPLQLSISARVQQAMEHELLTAMTKFSAKGAAGQGTDEARFNRATLGVWELGSTFKPFTVAMAMDSGIIKSFGKMYNCPHDFPAYGKVIHDTHPYGRACSVAEIMKESSNIGSAQIAAEVGATRQRAFLDKMGFLKKSDVELMEKGRPILPRDWGPLDVMTIGFGHSLAVSPLHLASGYSTLFNGGVYRPPTLLKVGKGHATGKGHRVFTEETSYKMRSLLRLVVTEGTGKKADAPGYRVGGKTGSAEKYEDRTKLVTSFAGVFPMDEPRYVMVMMLDEPQALPETYGFRTAAWNVGPAFGAAVSRIAPMLGVRPDKNREPDMSLVLPYVHEEAKH